jgi:hypothetical protein
MENPNQFKNIPKGITHNAAAGFIADNVPIPEKPLVLTKQQLQKFNFKNYSINGFYIGNVQNETEHRQIDILQSLMARESFENRQSCLHVFNSMSEDDTRRRKLLSKKEFANYKIDRGRNMIHISNTKERQLVKHARLVGEIVKHRIALDLGLEEAINIDAKGTNTPMVLTLLETEPAVGDIRVPDQLFHCDVNPNDKSLDRPDAYIGVLATQTGFTELRILCGSHLLTWSDTYKIPEFVYRIQLPQYFYFVGHPFLMHSGCSSLLRNTRLHFYHGLSQNSQSTTYFVKWKLSTSSAKLIKARLIATEKINRNAKKRKLALIGI